MTDYSELTTKSRLIEHLHAAGVQLGKIILVHTSMSRLGFVPGAERSVVEGLLEAVGPAGTVMMPAFSGELSDPSQWRHPPVPESWFEPILMETPAYDSALTPTRRMGAVAEYFRHFPGVVRSSHPQSSFAAFGPNSQELVGSHPLNYRFGPESPLGKLRDLGGCVLLLGAPPQTCSLFYLSQHYLEYSRTVERKAPIIENCDVTWKSYSDLEYTSHWFYTAFQMLVERYIIREFRIGASNSYLLPARETVDELVAWRRTKGV